MAQVVRLGRLRMRCLLHLVGRQAGSIQHPWAGASVSIGTATTAFHLVARSSSPEAANGRREGARPVGWPSAGTCTARGVVERWRCHHHQQNNTHSHGNNESKKNKKKKKKKVMQPVAVAVAVAALSARYSNRIASTDEIK